MQQNQPDLKQLLQDSGISQVALAEKLGISRQHLHNIIRLNRKSKYAEPIFNLLEQIKTNTTKPIFNTHSAETYTVEKLPLVALEDLLRLYQGDATLSLFNKPFYTRYPFVHFSHDPHHFCLRLDALFDGHEAYISLGAFCFFTPLKLHTGQIILVYLNDVAKVIMGRFGTNPDTGEQFISNNNSFYSIRRHDILLAECTEVIQILP